MALNIFMVVIINNHNKPKPEGLGLEAISSSVLTIASKFSPSPPAVEK